MHLHTSASRGSKCCVCEPRMLQEIWQRVLMGGVIWSRAGKIGGFVIPPEGSILWSPRAQEMGLREKEKGWHFLGLRV